MKTLITMTLSAAGIEQFNAIDRNNDQVVDAKEFAAETNGGFFEGE